MKQVLFVSLRDDDRIARLALDESGAVEPLDPVAVSGGPAPMAVDPQHRFLYVGQRRSRQISSYSIQSSGELRLLATIDVRSDPNFMITDRTGAFLLSSYYRGEGVHVHAVRDDGSLEPEAVEWRDTALSAHSFQTDPDNRFAYALHIAAGVGPNAIWQYRFDAASGRLCLIDPPLVHARNEAGPRHCCFHPRLPLLYACNEQGASVTRYRYDPTTGALDEEDTVSVVPAGYTGTSGCTQIRITADGRLLFAPLGGPDSMVSFVVDTDGRLRVSGHAPTEPGPRAFGLDAGERFVLSTGTTSGALSVFRIGHPGGRLTRVARTPLGNAPMWIIAVPAQP